MLAPYVRVSARLLLAGLWLGSACGEPECPEGETKIGKSCVAGRPRHADGGSAEVGERADLDAGSLRGAASQGTAQNRPDDGSAAGPVGADGSEVDPVSTDASSSDAAAPAAPCYLDSDGDGAGNAAVPVDCRLMSPDSGSSVAVARTSDDCDDNDPKRAPTLTDVCGDSIDNDCNGSVDDLSNNACGGPCLTALAHQPGQACDNGEKGVCLRVGVYQCDQVGGTTCNAKKVGTPIAETCDGFDNDCDGTVDDGLFNECGGACTAVLAHTPGETCTNGQLGACTASGTYVCQGALTVCNAPKFKPGVECRKSSNVDNNCDGTLDDSTTGVFGGGFLGECVPPKQL